MNATVVDGLISALEERNWLALDPAHLALLLGWMGRGERSEDLIRLERRIGRAGEDDKLLETAFELLDALLFDSERLREQVAGVGTAQTMEQRRKRYRLLLSVFHPDRYPAKTEWLTVRSQVITRAYGRFKSVAAEPEPVPVTISVDEPSSRPTAYGGIAPGWRTASELRRRFGGDRFLAHKLVGALALLAVLPVVSVLLDADFAPVEFPPQPAPADQWIGSDLQLQVDHWPLTAHHNPWLGSTTDQPPESDPKPVKMALPTTRPYPTNWMADATIGTRPDPKPPDPQPADPQLAAAAAPVAAARIANQPVAPTAAKPAAAPSSVLIATPPPDIAIAAIPERVDKPQLMVTATEPSDTTAPDRDEPEPGPDLQAEPGSVSNDKVAFSDRLTSGVIALGPLLNHEAGAVLADYQRSVEQGNLGGVLDALGRRPRENDNEGRDRFEQRYAEIFRDTDSRALSLRVISARRDGKGWLVEVAYLLELLYPDTELPVRRERQVRYAIAPDPFDLKIVEMDY